MKEIWNVAVGLELFLVIAVIVPLLIFGYLYLFDRQQSEHSVLRNFPLLGKVRYFLEKIGPELRQYLFLNDNEGMPFSRREYESVVKRGKYLSDKIGYGSVRDFEEEGWYIANAMLPLQEQEQRMDNRSPVTTERYQIQQEGLFSRKEKREEKKQNPYLLADSDVVVLGENCREPWRLKGLIGMSAMSYGALGDHALTALSLGLGKAGGTWMNTGEGGLTPYHLKGNTEIIMQIGPGLFGVRDHLGRFDWDELKRKAQLPQVRAFELKMGQGAKIRGGHVDGKKVSPEIASIRQVKPWETIDSPNRFSEFHDVPSMLDFLSKIRDYTGKPTGIKIVVGGWGPVAELAHEMKKTGRGPDFITVDGSEGGTGASFQDLADGVGLPNKSALMITDTVLREYGVRDQVKLIASGKLVTSDRIAVALGMGADLVNIARGFMISVGCIQALRCHTNQCPVGVATTDPKLQRALVVEEKKFRVTNYILALRKGLFRIAASAGLESPVQFDRCHVVYKDGRGAVYSLEDVLRSFIPSDIRPGEESVSIS
ncbi:FMN-binding glutamate synthase family protein [Salinithrix halophila]|uniref:FMN-binding glutamate synthase family protein n=1 Tax=Salinithrix halophila TaxID=1485204 RepID=A0ABV8JI88_9BACL